LINAPQFYQFLIRQGIHHFVGVPDSVLKDFTACIEHDHIVANEGSAVASACGYYLAHEKIPLVYLQNSGLGNALNPLTAVAQNYQIPMLFFIGWRGEGEDEPQHQVIGKASAKILEAIGVSCEVLSIEADKAKAQVIAALEKMKSSYAPHAFLIRRKTFAAHTKPFENEFQTSRISLLSKILDKASDESYFFSSVGYVGRELYQLMQQKKLNPKRFFFGTGGMGHINVLACEFAKHKVESVYCLDGDGSLAMHLGNALSLANTAPDNFKYIIFNNKAHLSVAGDGTVWREQNISKALEHLGLSPASSLEEIINIRKASFLELTCSTETAPNLPRPTETALELAQNFLGSDHGFKPI
jgi:phosphonopyruvate decarboxylase